MLLNYFTLPTPGEHSAVDMIAAISALDSPAEYSPNFYKDACIALFLCQLFTLIAYRRIKYRSGLLPAPPFGISSTCRNISSLYEKYTD